MSQENVTFGALVSKYRPMDEGGCCWSEIRGCEPRGWKLDGDGVVKKRTEGSLDVRR